MPKVNTPRVFTPEELSPVYRHFATTAVELFNREGSVSPQFFMVTLGPSPEDAIRAMSAVDPAMVAALMANSRTKDLVKPLIRMVLNEESPFRSMLRKKKLPLPDVIVQVTEAWLATPAEVPEVEHYQGSLEHVPGRKEAVLVVIHGQVQSMMGMCPVQDKPTRHAVFAELEVGAMVMTGRMSMNEEVPPSSQQH